MSRNKRSELAKIPSGVARSRTQPGARRQEERPGVLGYANGEWYDGEWRDDKPPDCGPNLLQFSGDRDMARALAQVLELMKAAGECLRESERRTWVTIGW